MSNYKELIFYQKSRRAVQLVDALIKSWPKSMQSQEISRQLFRSATSIGANIAEGHGRHQGTDYIHYLIIARASANETEHWLSTAKDCGFASNEKIDEILRLNNEVMRMITSAISTIRVNQGARSIQEDRSSYNTEDSLNLND